MNKIYLLLLTALILNSCGSFSKNETEENNKTIITRAFNNWKEGKKGGVFDLAVEDVVWTVAGRHHPVSRTYTNKKEFFEKVIQPFSKMFSSPIRPIVKEIYAEGDTVIAHFDGKGVTINNKQYHNTFVCIIKMNEGKIVEVIAFLDMQEFATVWDEHTSR